MMTKPWGCLWHSLAYLADDETLIEYEDEANVLAAYREMAKRRHLMVPVYFDPHGGGQVHHFESLANWSEEDGRVDTVVTLRLDGSSFWHAIAARFEIIGGQIRQVVAMDPRIGEGITHGNLRDFYGSLKGSLIGIEAITEGDQLEHFDARSVYYAQRCLR